MFFCDFIDRVRLVWAMIPVLWKLVTGRLYIWSDAPDWVLVRFVGRLELNRNKIARYDEGAPNHLTIPAIGVILKIASCGVPQTTFID